MLITTTASLLNNKLWKWVFLLLAILTYWGILQLSVQWAYSHPFNPDDGGPKVFALLFGWAFGLVIVVIPTYWLSKGIQWLVKKKRK